MGGPDEQCTGHSREWQEDDLTTDWIDVTVDDRAPARPSAAGTLPRTGTSEPGVEGHGHITMT